MIMDMAGVSVPSFALADVLSKIFPLNSHFLKNVDTPSTAYHLLPSDHSILIGNNNTHKSNLLFQAAVTLCSEGHPVTFICKNAMKRLPIPVHGMPRAEPSAVQQMSMLYLNDASELISYLSSIHEKTVLPHVLMVDDFQHYTSHSQGALGDHQAAKLCALLIDTAQFISSKLLSEGNCSCKLMVATEDSMTSRMHIYRRFFTNVHTVHTSQIKDTKSVYELSPWSPMKDQPHVGLKFTVQNEIILKEMFLTNK